jgi:hypothetical protein
MPRKNLRKRSRLVDEHKRRKGDPAVGGSTRAPIMTAYRQQALACAAALRDGPLRPRDLKSVVPTAANILRGNVYGWFERLDRGIYGLTASGGDALLRWSILPTEGNVEPVAGPVAVEGREDALEISGNAG